MQFEGCTCMVDISVLLEWLFLRRGDTWKVSRPFKTGVVFWAVGLPNLDVSFVY